MSKYRNGFLIKYNKAEDIKLPVAIVTEEDKCLVTAKAKLHSLMKKQIANVLNGHPENFDKELTDFLTQYGNTYYNSGLRDMDRMHAVIDNQKG
jgi:hypothetical protein